MVAGEISFLKKMPDAENERAMSNANTRQNRSTKKEQQMIEETIET